MQRIGKRQGRHLRGWARLWALIALVLAAWPAYPATRPTAAAAGQQRAAVAAKELIYVSDGMRPDLVAKYVQAGSMPNYAKIFNDGVTSKNGMVPEFPPNTGAGWTAIASG